MIYDEDDFDETIPDPEDAGDGTDGIEDVFGNGDAGEPPAGEPDIPEAEFNDSDYQEADYQGDYQDREPSGETDAEETTVSDDTPENPPDIDSDTIQKVQPVEPFVPEKSSADAILGSSRPRKLNNQLILTLGVSAFAVIFIVATFIVPLFNRKKAEQAAKPQATAVNPSDYSAMIPRKNQRPEEEEDEEELDRIIEELPPIDPQYRYEEPPPVTAADTPSAASERPNTRDDRLQAKSISGIKGITPSQKNYLSGPGTIPYQNYQQTPAAADPANPYAQFGLPAKDDYTRQMLSAYQGASADSYARQNDQSNKMLFYNQGRENAGNGTWLGPASLWQGTIFEATLTSSINTDLPGEAAAWVTKNIYSSLDGRYLLIPQNSRLFGSYNSSISYSQSRVQVGWHTLIRPDGYMINLGAMQATDPQGAAGLKGMINDHPFQYLKALGLLTAFNIINIEFGANAANTENQYVQNIMANSQEIANTLGSKLIDRALDVQPTITIKAGTKINIVVNTNLTLPPLPPYDVTMPYHKGE